MSKVVKMNAIEKKAVEGVFRKYLKGENLNDALEDLKETFNFKAVTEFEKAVSNAVHNAKNPQWVKITDVFKDVNLSRSNIILFSKTLDKVGIERKRTKKERLVFIDLEEMERVESYIKDGLQLSDISN